MENMDLYQISNITELNNISKKQQYAIQKAIDIAETSDFDSSLRLGSVCIDKKQCFLWS
jgi:hypothetical protein